MLTIAYAALGALSLISTGNAEYCPSFAPQSSENKHHCAIPPHLGKNPSPEEWERIFSIVARGPKGWSTQGPAVDSLGSGCRSTGPEIKAEPRFPCEILKVIAMVESKSTQFCRPTAPKDQVNPKPETRTLVTFDCGYGVLQVTSMMHDGETAPWDRLRVAADPLYNLAVGAKILGEKWNKASCVGNKQPDVLEHWYLALWAYNGFSYLNHPANPHFSPTRSTFKMSAGGEYPYQEKIFGLLENPPKGANWNSVQVAYPNLSDVIQVGFRPASHNGGKGSAVIPEPSCASPTDCSQKRTTHKSTCFGSTPSVSGAREVKANLPEGDPAR